MTTELEIPTFTAYFRADQYPCSDLVMSGIFSRKIGGCPVTLQQTHVPVEDAAADPHFQSQMFFQRNCQHILSAYQ